MKQINAIKSYQEEDMIDDYVCLFRVINFRQMWKKIQTEMIIFHGKGEREEKSVQGRKR